MAVGVKRFRRQLAKWWQQEYHNYDRDVEKASKAYTRRVGVMVKEVQAQCEADVEDTIRKNEEIAEANRLLEEAACEDAETDVEGSVEVEDADGVTDEDIDEDEVL